MPQKRKDAKYLHLRIPELYRDHTAKEVAAILSEDANVLAPVTERVVYNILNKIRPQRDEQADATTLYKDNPWTDYEDATLEQWYAAGADIPMIARQVQRSVPAVHARIRTRKLANRKITPEQEQAVRDCIRCSRKSLQEIAYELGLKYQSVRHVSDKLKKELKVTQRHKSNVSFWQDGSLEEKLIRNALIKEYGNAVVHWSLNRVWSKGRGWQIDIPIEFSSGLKVAIEVNDVRTHAHRRNQDYAKRRFAESIGWTWVPIWFEDGELKKESIAYALDTIYRIIDDLKRGETDFYRFYMSLIEERERHYYHPDQPPYDPKEGVSFGEPWSNEDEDIVQNHYGKMPVEELRAMLSTPRTEYAVVHKARHLGLTHERKNFSPEEDNIIREVYPDSLEEYILVHLPGRSWQSITSRASRLGVKRRDVWKQREEAILAEHYSSTSDEELMVLLPGRTLDSIRTRAHRLGLKKSGWTPEEDNKLSLVYPGEPRSVIESALPHRSWLAIASRASRLGIKRTKPF